MITRFKIRDKIAELLNNKEFNTTYYDKDGNITGAPAIVLPKRRIPQDDINSLLNGKLNETTVAPQKTFVITTAQSSEIPPKILLKFNEPENWDTMTDEEQNTYASNLDHYDNLPQDLLDEFNSGTITESDFKYTPEGDDAEEKSLNLGLNYTSKYNTNWYKKSENVWLQTDYSSLEDEEAVIKTWMCEIPERGSFFDNLDFDCLTAAAVYELAMEKIEALEEEIIKLKNR